MLEVLKLNSLYAKRSKCTFAQQQIEYLGHLITANGVATDPSKVAAITQWPTPTNITELRGFLGLAGYYRRFINGYGVICRPLFNALKKNSISWTPEQQVIVEELKKIMTTAPVLALPNFSKPFI